MICATFAGLVALAAGTSAPGCAPRPGPPPDRLRVGIESQVPSLDPRFAADANSSRIAGLVHCSLVDPDGRGGWTPSLAASWRETEPGTWQFELRGDARFHDGTPVAASDVVRTFGSVLDPSSLSPKRAALGSVASVEEAGPRAVRVILHAPDAALFEGLSIGVLPSRLAALGRIDAPQTIGCGPYRVRSASDESVVLAASDTWHGGAITLPSIEFRVVPDTVMRTLQLASGELDLVQNALEPDAVRHLASGSEAVAVSMTPYDASQYLGINHRHFALRDVRVRRAIASAIDREAIVAHVLAGQAEVASGLLPPHHAYFSGKGRRFRRDVPRALRLLDRAGFPDPDGAGPRERFSLRYTTSTVELRRRIAEVVASNLADAGIRVSIESYEWGTFFSDIGRGNFDLFSLAWIGIRDPDLYRVVFHSKMVPPAGSNRGFFASARMDRLLERARAERDAGRRRALYARVERAAARQLPYVPLWWPKNVVVMSKRVEGFTPHPAGDLTALAKARLKKDLRYQ